MFSSKDIFLTPPSGGYTIARSVRLRSSASAYFNRTFGTPTSGNIFTWSGWVKRGAIGATQPIFNPSLVAGEGAAFNASNQLTVAVNGAVLLTSTPVYRDPSSWYHIMLVSDMGNATATLRFRVYVNGVEVTAWATDARASYTSFPYWNKNAVVHYMGYSNAYPAYADGYLTEINFIDGQALTPSSFGSTNAITGVWQPAKYTGTYGTNGFYLNFSDNSSNTATTIGKDYSGNGNNWTPNNISVTAGSTYDSMVDSPTVSAVSSNYCVLNPLTRPVGAGGAFTVGQGNLQCAMSYIGPDSTFAMSSGKWYWEVQPTGGTAAYNPRIGIVPSNHGTFTGCSVGDPAGTYGYTASTGNKGSGGTYSAYGATYTDNDIIGVALDMDSGTLAFYKNGTSQGTAYTGLSGEFFASVGSGGTGGGLTLQFNFGQRPFSYTPPTGFVALNTNNLPASTIKNGAAYMAATLYTGNLTGQSITNTASGASFQPDLVWIKSRSAATDNKWTDSVRGATKALVSNSSAAETTDTTGVTAFNSNGFTLGISTVYNNTATTYVAWQWQAGASAGSSNTNGSITSTVSVGATQGFSVVTFTGTGAAGITVGHGLGVVPAMLIVKSRGTTGNWLVYHKSLGNTGGVALEQTTAFSANVGYWNNTSPTSSVFTLGTFTPASTAVAYCFAAVAGYSAFGSYTGNGSTDGPFVYLGFRPRWILTKETSAAGNYWIIHDTSRDTYNAATLRLYPNVSDAEAAATDYDILANGFKLRTAITPNISGSTYIYACFAENPFKNSLAR